MGKTVISITPAAAPASEWLACADFITPNETELRILTGELPKSAPMGAPGCGG